MSLPRRFLPSLGALRALEALERLGSLTAVAEELNLSQSAVSRQLQTLESQLGVPLFVREGRRVRLTPQTREYAGETRAALNRISQASLKLALNPGGGSLNLAILPTFGMRWLVPRLPEFAAAHPEVTLNLSTRLKPFNFAVEPFDAAILFGDGGWPGTQSLRLKSEAVVAVAAPALLERTQVSGPDDVLSLPLLHIETRPEAWRAWFAAHGVETGSVAGTIYDQFSTITQAALHGLGVALLPDYLAEQDLATGKLVPVWGGRTDSPGAYHLVWPEEKAQDSAVTKFRDWLAPQAEDEDPLPR
ncbi:Glycine cleavage system transcriptional activator [Roseovarius sp. THAF9]|uniref:LysR substrate-binding domain-containing protein n=1 Tax=Roseovarius sp. THAF9 TaxID=2587847 RepID=UPI001268E0DA|nr:LysR substrate-binding domain-containing protein [Roseovarius sp. THAF9]QFT93016.1 Glycine cleavage system transcriptional activator [Roseovarius sp. THAF9]